MLCLQVGYIIFVPSDSASAVTFSDMLIIIT